MLLRMTLLSLVTVVSATRGRGGHHNPGYQAVPYPHHHTSSTSMTSTTSMTSSSTSTTSIAPSQVTLVTIPATDTENLCPAFDGRCLNANYIRCDREIADDSDPLLSGYTCTHQSGINTERQCHETCVANTSCSGWDAEREWGETGPDEFALCCHISGFVGLLASPPTHPTDLLYHSYGLRSRCPAAERFLCPKSENYCVDNFHIRCGRALTNDISAAISSAYQPAIEEERACHQACAQDPACVVWYGDLEFVFELEGSESFNCYHVTGSTPQLKPVLATNLPATFNIRSYGIKGLCD